MSPFLGELIGTALLIIFGAGVCAGVNLKKSYAANSGWIVITMGWGLAVAVAAYAVGQYSGAHLNPALTVALALAGDFPWKDVPGYITAQVLGAVMGAVIVYLHYWPHWKETDDPGVKLGVFATGPAVPNAAANLLSEIIGTFVLVLAILAVAPTSSPMGLIRLSLVF